MDRKNKYDYIFNSFIIGNCEVGKTCLIEKFIDDIFTSNHLSTISLDFKVKPIKIEKKLIKLQIWDLGGQERFRHIVEAYYKKMNGIIIVYDVTNKYSFKNITDYYLKAIEYYCNQDVVKVLVGNKCDAPGRVVTEEEGKSNYQRIIIWVSSKFLGNVEDVLIKFWFSLQKKFLTN